MEHRWCGDEYSDSYIGWRKHYHHLHCRMRVKNWVFGIQFKLCRTTRSSLPHVFGWFRLSHDARRPYLERRVFCESNKIIRHFGCAEFVERMKRKHMIPFAINFMSTFFFHFCSTRLRGECVGVEIGPGWWATKWATKDFPPKNLFMHRHRYMSIYIEYKRARIGCWWHSACVLCAVCWVNMSRGNVIFIDFIWIKSSRTGGTFNIWCEWKSKPFLIELVNTNILQHTKGRLNNSNNWNVFNMHTWQMTVFEHLQHKQVCVALGDSFTEGMCILCGQFRCWSSFNSISFYMPFRSAEILRIFPWRIHCREAVERMYCIFPFASQQLKWRTEYKILNPILACYAMNV